MSQRRSVGGPRREATERVTVTIRAAGEELEAWTLNVSRGGLRVIVEDPITVGAECDVVIGEASSRPARVVWVRDESDGQIVGMQFMDVDGEVPPSTIPPAL